MVFTDQIGVKIELKNRPIRIISVVPSQTELLYDLCLGNDVVGITNFCIHPEDWFRTKSRVGGTKNLDLKKIIEGKYDFGVYEKGMATSDIALDNNGKIYISYKLNDAFTEKIKVAKGEDEMATYQPHLLSIDISKVTKDFSINCLNKLVGKCYINVNPNNEVSLNAFYEKKLNRGFIGFGSYNFNATNSNAVMMFTELSKDLIKQMDKDGSGIHDGLHWGFEFRNAFYFNNETTQLIFEKFLIEYTNTFSGNKSVPITNYEFGDILVVTLNKNNTMPVFTRVAKRQENSVNQHGILGFNPRKQIAYSFQPIIFKNELLIFIHFSAGFLSNHH